MDVNIGSFLPVTNGG